MILSEAQVGVLAGRNVDAKVAAGEARSLRTNDNCVSLGESRTASDACSDIPTWAGALFTGH